MFEDGCKVKINKYILLNINGGDLSDELILLINHLNEDTKFPYGNK